MSPRQIGPYIVIEELKKGPHARIFSTLDTRQGREIAIKLLDCSEFADPTIRARFQLEAQLLSNLNSPAILACEEFGEQAGHPFIAMRWLPGGSLADTLRYDSLPVTETARILERLAPALDAAHSLGIVHGDIKPSNILFDENDLPVLADFGMANLLRAQVAAHSQVLVGPPVYISPEAALAGAGSLAETSDGYGPASDLYMLAAVLFEMLTGQAPFQAETALGLAVQHLSRPVPPVTSLRPELSPAWDEVLRIALAKEPSARYTSARELAAAARAIAFQGAEAPTEAPPPVRMPDPSWRNADYQSTLVEPPAAQAVPTVVTRRRRPLATALLLLTVALLVGLLAFTQGRWLPLILPASPPQATTPAPPAVSLTPETAGATLPIVLASATVPLPTPSATASLPTATLTATLPPTPTLIPETAVPPSAYTVQYNDTLFTVASQYHVDLAEMLGINNLSCDSRLAVGKDIIIPPAYTYLDPPKHLPVTIRNLKQLTLQHIVDCAAHIKALDFSPDGHTLAVAEDVYIYLWNVGDWKPFLRLKGHQSEVTSLQFSPDGLTLLSGSYDATLKLWKVSDGSLITTFKGHANQVTDVAFHPGGQQIVSTSRDFTARLWQVDGTPLHTFSGYPTFSAAFSPDGVALALGYADSVRLYSLSDLSLIRTLPSADVVTHLVFSPDGLLLASSSDLWHATEGRQIYHFHSSGDATAFTSDGLALLTGRRAWQIANGKQLKQLVSPLAEALRTGDVWDSLAYSPATGLLAWGTPEGLYIYSLPGDAINEADTSTRLHVAATGDTVYNIATTYQVYLPQFLSLNGIQCDSPIFAGQNLWLPDDAGLIPDTSPLSPIQPGNAAQLVALRTFEMDCTLTNSDLFFSADGQKLVSGSSLWDVPTGSINIQSTNVPRNFDGTPDSGLLSPLLVISPDQQTLAVRAGSDIQLWEMASGRLMQTLRGHQDIITSLVYSPDGSLLVSGSGTGEQKIIFWNPQDGTQVKVYDGWTVLKLRFSQNGEYLLGEGDDALRIWRMSDDRLVSTLQGVVGDIAYSPDGLLVAFASCSEKEKSVCVQELVSLFRVVDNKVSWSVKGFTEDITGIRFSPDGLTVASSAGNGITLVNASDGTLRERLYQAGNLVDVVDFQFSPDGSLLFSTWANRVVRIWDTRDGSLISTLSRPVDRMAFSPDQTMWAVLSNNLITIWGIK